MQRETYEFGTRVTYVSDTNQSNNTDKGFGHLAEQSPLSLSFKLLVVLLWRIFFSSILLSSLLFPSFFSLIFWRDDGDVCPRWPTHQNTRDLAPYFRQKHHTLCCPKEKMWMRIYPGESALPIAHQKPSPPPAVKEKCQSNEGMRSVEKVIQWWSFQPLCSSHEWKRQSNVSNWPHFGLTPPSDILRGRFRHLDAALQLFVKHRSRSPWEGDEHEAVLL